ncbi:STAS domain-containing protein [bacterium]|nr:STAS domain-containing protein [bacterium]
MSLERSFNLRRHARHDVAVVEISGQLVLDGIADLNREILVSVPRDKPYLVLDVSGVTYSDSSGLSTLFAVQSKIVRAGGTMALCGMHGHLKDLMQVCNIGDVFAAFATQEEALQHVQEERARKTGRATG